MLLSVSSDDLIALDPILAKNAFEKPTIKISVYKNRRGQYKGILLWCKANLGCCRITPMFATTYDYELLSINNMQIQLEENSAF